ncbi:hypothetical protein CHCC14814_2312 [Bacillus paralicheniformis]|nr:hypothetical protein CHCC14814_2312 [Bacillus paralicheniformis]
MHNLNRLFKRYFANERSFFCGEMQVSPFGNRVMKKKGG